MVKSLILTNVNIYCLDGYNIGRSQCITITLR
jgi:hypothetical protein